MDQSHAEARTNFRVSLYTRILLLAGGVVFLAFAALSFASEGPLVSGFFLLFGLISLGSYLAVNRTVFVTPTGIGTRRFGREQFIRWENIAAARPRGDDSLSLTSADQMTTLKISGMLASYAVLVETIRQARPDLWNSAVLRVFHTKIWIIGVWLMMAAGSIAGGWLAPDGQGVIAPLFGTGFGLIMLAFALLFPRSIHLEDDFLVIRRLVGAMRIPRGDLQMVSLGQIGQVNTVAMQGVTLHYRDARKNKDRLIQFNNIKEGSAALYASLYEWGGFARRGEKPGGGVY